MSIFGLCTRSGHSTMDRLVYVVAGSLVLLLAGCGGGGGSATPPPAKLVNINISPTNVSIAINTTASLNAIGSYSDGSTKNITPQVTWTSAASSVASVGTNTGLVTAGASAGTTTITPSLIGWTFPVSASVNITVNSSGGILASSNTLAVARYDHTASLISGTGPNAGKVLVMGGYGISSTLKALDSVELYDPVASTWSSQVPLLNFPRGDHTSVSLPDGRILVTGGTDSASLTLSSTELCDPVTLAWSTTGPLNVGRSYNSITLLANGQVLVAGGDKNTSPPASTDGTLTSAEVYIPIAASTAGTWTTTGSMATARDQHTATLLPSGKVLVAGGFNSTNLGLSSSELYDPSTSPSLGSWSPTTGSLAGVRYAHTATLLNTGKVLVVGGYGAGTSTLDTAELYDPATGTWSATGSLATARTIHTATLLTNGKVLVAGGIDSFGNTLSSTEVYDPTSGTWTTTSNLATARDNFTATVLIDGKVLAAGGYGTNSILNSSELYW